MKWILPVGIILTFALSAAAQDASTAWRDVIRRCAKTDLIGKQSLFFGVSNPIGPGSVWRRANDRSIRLVSVLSDAVPSSIDQALIVRGNNVASCAGKSFSRWNLRLGLPFTTGATRLTLDIGALLGGAHDVTVSIQGYALDTLDESQWKKAYAALGRDNAFYKEIFQTDRLLAENSVKITGLTAVFNYSHDLSANVTAKYQGKSFTLGNSSTPTTGQTSKSINTASNNSQANPSGAATTSTSPLLATSGDSGACKTNAAGNTRTNGAANGATSQNVPSDGSATLHVEFSGSRQINICVDGSFYLLASYSEIVNGAPVGLEPTTVSVNDVRLTDAAIPKNASAESDRTPR